MGAGIILAAQLTWHSMLGPSPRNVLLDSSCGDSVVVAVDCSLKTRAVVSPPPVDSASDPLPALTFATLWAGPTEQRVILVHNHTPPGFTSRQHAAAAENCRHWAPGSGEQLAEIDFFGGHQSPNKVHEILPRASGMKKKQPGCNTAGWSLMHPTPP